MGVEAVWASYPGDSTRTAEARRGDSGEACGKHGTQRQAEALVAYMWSDKLCRDAEAVLTSTRFKLVTGSIGTG